MNKKYRGVFEMIIKTKYHGDIEIDQNTIWKFENGLPGFPVEKEFALLHLPDNQVFSILQSTTTSEIAFIITSPFSFFNEYEFILDDQTLEQLDIKTQTDVRVFVLLTVQEPFEKTTANLLAPVVFNVRNNKAKQIILNNTNYETKHPLFTNKIEKVEG